MRFIRNKTNNIIRTYLMFFFFYNHPVHVFLLFVVLNLFCQEYRDARTSQVIRETRL